MTWSSLFSMFQCFLSVLELNTWIVHANEFNSSKLEIPVFKP